MSLAKVPKHPEKSNPDRMRIRVVNDDGIACNTQITNAETGEPIAIRDITLRCKANGVWMGKINIFLPRCDITADVEVERQCLDAKTVKMQQHVIERLREHITTLEGRISELTGKTEA